MLKAFQIEPEQARKLDNDGYIFELKIDGSREFWLHGDLVSARCINHNERYRHVFNALTGVNAILDGEICLHNSNVLELNKKENWSKAVYYVFDILELGGKDLRNKPLHERQAILNSIITTINNPNVKFITQFKDFKSGWDYIMKNDLEGLMAKKKDSTYDTIVLKERRSHNWFKIKNWLEGKDEIIGHNIRTTQKGSFALSCGTNVNCPDMETLKEYNEAIKKNKKVFAEFYYRFKSKNGFYTPILKRLVIV